MNKSAFLVVLGAVALSGCSSVTVSRDYDRNIDFSALKTYAWKHAEQPDTGNPRIDNDLIDNRIRQAIDESLAAKGFSLAKGGDADILVAYFIDYKQRIGGSSVSFGIGGGRHGRYGGIGYDTAINDYEEGHLTIDFIDPGNEKNIWRGVGKRTSYDDSSPERITKIVNKAVSRILAKFPPEK